MICVYFGTFWLFFAMPQFVFNWRIGEHGEYLYPLDRRNIKRIYGFLEALREFFWMITIRCIFSDFIHIYNWWCVYQLVFKFVNRRLVIPCFKSAAKWLSIQFSCSQMSNLLWSHHVMNQYFLNLNNLTLFFNTLFELGVYCF